MNKRNRFIAIIFVIWTIISSSFAFGQNNITLHIGDNAPELRYSKWIKGSPVKSYEKDRMYVLEFWATWCVPCKIAMPHLSELARKYKSTTTFIGVNSGEMTGGKPYETVVPEISKFVAAMGKDMDYDVIADDNDMFMGKQWFKASGQVTIPTTYLIKEGKLIWIGHPDSLETVMLKAHFGTYDMAAFKSKFEGRVDPVAAAFNRINLVMTPIYDLISAKKYTEALALIDKSMLENRSLSSQLGSVKFDILIDHVNEKDALAFVREWTSVNSSDRYIAGKNIADRNGLSKETYEFAAQIFELKRKEPRALKPVMDHLLAICYFKAGSINNAVLMEEEALEGAKAALKDGKWPGAISHITVSDYEQKLKEYKKYCN